MNHLKRHLSVANVLSCVALFVALSGAAYAATAIGNKAVKTRNLANGSVTTLKLRGGAVTTLKLRNGAVTGAKIATGAVGSTQIADGGVRSIDLGGGVVTTAKLKSGAVTGEKLANGAVTSSKLGADAVTAGKIQDGAVTGAKLATSLSGQLVKNVSYVPATSANNTSEATKTVTANCPTGKRVVGGGVKVFGGDKLIAVLESAPAQLNAAGWTVVAREAEPNTVNWSVEATAICAEF